MTAKSRLWCALLAGIATFFGSLHNAETALAAETARTISAAPIPGPRDCFWARGPFSADPYINVAYPDSATFYWAATFTIPEGARLRFDGRFPHARYMSLISYDAAGRPIESVADYLIAPADGAANPFRPGSRRDGTRRDYSLSIVDAQPPRDQPVGMNLHDVSRDTLHAPRYGAAPGQQVVLYRIYAIDHGRDETGGAGLPVPVLQRADGVEVRGDAACKELRTAQTPQLDPTAMAVPMEKYRELLAAAAKLGPLRPATNPPTWYQQLDRESLYKIYTGEPIASDAPKSEGGFYPNLDNQYIRTVLNRKMGRVFVLRAKAPTTPRTVSGNPLMEPGQLRYWSWCSNQGFANTRVNDCVHDENIPVAADGTYTLVVSRKADRPRNAIAECGVSWLPMADDGDGSIDDDVTVLQLRHMLGQEAFPHAIQGVRSQATMAEDMADYFPRGRYMTTGGFEALLPCATRGVSPSAK